jgi:two-component system LytT family response regulator
MKQIKTIIIEDEQEDLDLMINLLKTHVEIEIVASARDIENGVAVIAVHKPDLIFLDINLYGRTSFELLDIIKNFNINPKIIFVTAFDNYMSKAFKYATFDYLLKPIDRLELQNTLGRFVQNQAQTPFEKSYELLSETKQKLLFNTTEGFELIDPKKVVYLATVKNQSYTDFFMLNGTTVTVTKSIGEIEESLPKKHFFKIHRSYILNLTFVKKVNRMRGKCYLQGNTEDYIIPISREKAKVLKDVFLKRLS